MQEECRRTSFRGHRAGLLLGLLGLLGCDQAPSLLDPPAVLPFAGQEVRLVCPDPWLRDQMVPYTRVWSSQSGAQLTLLEHFPADDGWDGAVVSPIELTARAEQLASVPASLRSVNHPYAWGGILPVYRDKLLRWDEQPLALPILGEAQVLVYRQDLWTDAQHQQNFKDQYRRELTPPQTWEDVAELAYYFTAARQRPALPPLPTQATALEQAFFTVAVPYDRQERRTSSLAGLSANLAEARELLSFHYDLNTLKPRLSQPAFVHALEWFQSVYKCRPGQPVDDPAQAFLDGQAVLAIVSLQEIARFQAPDSPVRNRFGIVPIPGASFTFDRIGQKRPVKVGINRIPYLGTDSRFGVVRKGSPHLAAAFDFWAYLGLPESTSAEILSDSRWGTGPFRLAHVDSRNRAYWLGYDLDASRTEALRLAITQQVPATLINPALRLRTPDAQAHLAILAQRLRPAMEPDQDAGKALQEIAKAWQKLDQQLPEAQRRVNYRLSLGLRR